MAADPARIAKVIQAVRYAGSEDATVKTFVRDARSLEIATLLYNTADAVTENARQFDLVKVARDRFAARVHGHNFTFAPGQTVTITYPRFGLSGGRDFIITGVQEEPALDRTTLKLWG